MRLIRNQLIRHERFAPERRLRLFPGCITAEKLYSN